MTGATTARPVQFRTIERKMVLMSGTLNDWSRREGFPVAGTGVALESDVREWAAQNGLWNEQDGQNIDLSPVPAEDATNNHDDLFADGVSAPVPVSSPVESQSQLPQSPESGPSENAVEDFGIIWVDIRVPVCLDPNARPRLANAPVSSFRFNRGTHEQRGRVVLGRVFEALNRSHTARADGSHVDKVPHALKWLLEEVAAAVGSALPES